MITVLGKLEDTKRYVSLDGYNVLATDNNDWSFERNIDFLEQAVQRGDCFLLVSTKADGVYGDELRWLVHRLTSILS